MKRVVVLLSLLLEGALGFGSYGSWGLTVAAGEDCLGTCHSMQDECFDGGASVGECNAAMSWYIFPFAQLADWDYFDCDVACTGERDSGD